MPSLHGAQAKPCRIPMSIGTWDSATTTVWTRMVAWPRLAIFFRLGFDHVPPIRTGAQTTGLNATLCDCVDGWSRGRDGYSCRTRTRVNRQQRRPWQSTLEAVRTKQSRRLVTFASAASGMALAGAVLAAPPANAGRQYGGIAISKCDGPVQPDGTWQRCVEFFSTRGSGSGSFNDRRCDLMGPDLHPWGLAFADPPTHIDD